MKWNLFSLIGVTHGRRCLDPATLAGFVDRALGEEEQIAIRKHLIRCDSCFEAVSQLSQLKGHPLPELPSSLERKAKELGRSRPPVLFPQPAWKLVGSVAVVFIGIVLGLVFWKGDAPGSGEALESFRTVRSAGEAGLEVRMLSPLPLAILQPESVHFSWEEIAGATAYQVSVVNLEGDLVWHTRIQGGLSATPSGSELAPGDYFVSVEATLADSRFVKGEFVRFGVTE